MNDVHLNLLSLPRKAFENIVDLLSERAIIQLLQVCKTVNESVCSLVGTRETELNFTLSTKPDGRTMITIRINNRRQYFLWQCAFFHILTKQNLSGLSQFVEIVSEYDCHFFRIFGILIPEEVECFLTHFKCLTCHTKIAELTLFFLELKMIQMFTHFFEGKFIQCINVYDWDKTTPTVTPWSILLEKVRTDLIRSEMSTVNQFTADFLLQHATMSNSMVTRVTSPTTKRWTAPFINEILSRKCNKLDINTEMSLDELEKLLQYFHHSDKTIQLRISAWWSGIYIDTQVGVYTVKTDNYKRKNIKHL